MRARIQKISKYAPSIFQGRFDFSSRKRGFSGHGISFATEHAAEPAILRGLFAILALSVCAYMYFVGVTIFNVIERKEALVEITHLTGVVSDLERQYFAAAQEIGPDDGTRLGLSPVAEVAYIQRPGNAAAAALGSNEI